MVYIKGIVPAQYRFTVAYSHITVAYFIATQPPIRVFIMSSCGMQLYLDLIKLIPYEEQLKLW